VPGDSYLAFPTESFSRFIVLSQNATGQTNIITPRWFKLPTGIQLAFSNTNNLFTITNFSFPLPNIDGVTAPTDVRTIRFNRFGSIKSTGNLQANLQLIIGEGFSDATNPVPTFTAPPSVFIPQPLLGKWIPATNN
jgi:hypothetical protein